jgi:heat shock transcription factor
MSGTNPRKRAAPGAAPIIPVQPQQQQHQQQQQQQHLHHQQQQQQQQQQPYLGGNAGADQLMRWNIGGDGTNYLTNNGYDLLQPGMQIPQGVPAAAQSTSLTRRQGNHALVPTNTQANYNTAVEPWTGVGDHDVSLLSGDPGENLPTQDNVEVLEEMAQKAKREAQHKRKQIPPFVQKLSR